MNVTTTHTIETVKGDFEIKAACRVSLGTEPTRHHDGDLAEVIIEEVSFDGEILTGKARLLALTCVGVDEIEIEAINQAKSQMTRRAI